MKSIEMTEYEEEEIVKIVIKNSDAVIICTDTIPGNILPDQCERCGTDIIYSMNEDVMFCGLCNEWLEKLCDDPTSEYYSENKQDQPLTMGSFL
jgi:hypothetical protein